MRDAIRIFDRYEGIRPRLPLADTPSATIRIGSLEDIADDIDAFVFDAFGVLNIGERRIDGADQRLASLRARGCQIRVLTNAASYDRAGAIAKFKRLGFRLMDEEIVTSRDATLRNLPQGHLGVIAADADPVSDLPHRVTRLGDRAADYDAVDAIVFLSTADWTDARQALLHASLSKRPRPLLIGNADLAAPRENGFTREPGYFGHLIADAIPGCVAFFGKPYPDVYALAEATLPGIDRHRVAMCGDTLHTDILGAAAFGWRTVLVTADGLLSGLDWNSYCIKSRIYADWTLARI